MGSQGPISTLHALQDGDVSDTIVHAVVITIAAGLVVLVAPSTGVGILLLGVILSLAVAWHAVRANATLQSRP